MSAPQGIGCNFPITDSMSWSHLEMMFKHGGYLGSAVVSSKPSQADNLGPKLRILNSNRLPFLGPFSVFEDLNKSAANGEWANTLGFCKEVGMEPHCFY